jgi:Protein of unknown function (DUF2584)
MGMPCQVNSILKLSPDQYPELVIGMTHSVVKEGYRIIPMDVPIPLVDRDWFAHADVVIHQLTWENQTTQITFQVTRIYPTPFSQK